MVDKDEIVLEPSRSCKVAGLSCREVLGDGTLGPNILDQENFTVCGWIKSNDHDYPVPTIPMSLHPSPKLFTLPVVKK